MEVIEDELKKNGVPVDIETISEHINYILNNYRDTYNDSVNLLRLSSNEENVLNVFSSNGREYSRTCCGLLDTCVSNESYFERGDST